jgi:hypothetical protein
MEHVNQSGLTDASLAGDEYDLPVPVQRFIETVVESGQGVFATDNRFCRTRGQI